MKKNGNLLLINLKKVCFSALFIFLAFSFSKAQSTNQNTPTPVSSNEINGRIPARSIGDSRLTNYFYAFNGNQGDVFINVVTKNLDGDIDIFTIEGLRPLTKITVFSDNSENETGRIVYLRKFEKLLLRIQGRSPNDDPATFRIKFAGSFQALENVAGTEETKLPEINTSNQGDVRVSSVGTIIERVPKPTPAPKEIAETPVETSDPETPVSTKEITVTSVEETKVGEVSAKIEIKRANPEEKVAEKTETETPKKVETPVIDKPEVVVTEDIPAEKEDKKVETEQPEEVKTENKEVEETKTEAAESKPPLGSSAVLPMKREQLEKIELVVRFKDGKILKQPLSKVFSFNVNQGILTIVLYDGTVSRYSFLDIERISMEEGGN